MELIEKHDIPGFQKYLEETENTICGEKAIQVLLALVNAVSNKCETKFVNYAQSSKVESKEDSSVSYASSYTLI